LDADILQMHYKVSIQWDADTCVLEMW
jgi:hypothetical protein